MTMTDKDLDMTQHTRRRRSVAGLALAPLLACGLPAFAASASAADGIPTQGLLAEYDFSETAGVVLHDSAGANDAEIVGGAGWQHGTMRFDGGNHVELPEDVLAGQTEASVTVEARPSAASLSGANFLWNIGGSGDEGTGQFFVHTPGHRASISTSDWRGESTVESPTAFVADEWQSIVTTIEPNEADGTSTLSLYVDGELTAQNTESSANLADLPEHTNNLIGASAYSGDARFHGAISSYRLYDRALAADEIAAISSADAVTSVGETIAGIDPGDVSAVRRDLTLPSAGGVTWESSNPQAVEADGTIHRLEGEEGRATLTATATVRGTTEQRQFEVTVAQLPPVEDRASADLEAISLHGVDDVRDHLTLPSTGDEFASEIVWTADSAGIISTEQAGDRAPGFVTRPAHGETDADVQLTATVPGTNATRTFRTTVRALPEAEETSDYLFAHFTDGRSPSVDNEQIYFATSDDGIDWHDLNDERPVLESTVGETGARDPFLVRAPGGDKYYLIATDLSTAKYGWRYTPDNPGSSSLVVWESTDLVTWSEPRLADVASKIPDVGAAWAPEATYDLATGEYMVYWASISGAAADHPLGNELGDPMNMYYATTRDFVTFSDPVKWIDREHSIIDTTMLEVDGTFYRASGDGQITIEASDDPYATTVSASAPGDNPGGWGRVSTLRDIFDDDGYTGGTLEGPELFVYNPEDWQTDASGEPVPTWGLIADRYGTGQGYLPFRTTDLSSTASADEGGAWSVGDDIDFGSVLKRHGTILPITPSEYRRVQNAYGEALGVTVDVTTRCVAGRNVLAASVTNSGDEDLDVTVSTPYGDRAGVDVAAGATAMAAFSTRASDIPAGSVTVSADGASTTADYSAAHCG